MLLTTLRSISTIARIKRKQCILAIGLCYYRSEPVDGSMSVPVNSEVCLVARWGAVFFLAGGRGGKLHWLRWMSGKDVVFLVCFLWFLFIDIHMQKQSLNWCLSDDSLVSWRVKTKTSLSFWCSKIFYKSHPWVVPFSPAWHLPCLKLTASLPVYPWK